MGRNTSISLGEYFEDFVRSQTESNCYKIIRKFIQGTYQ